MWQEARRQERAIRSAMVNYKKRAERRRDYYEKIKQDPIKFLRLYGRPSKIHYDNETALAAENPRNMVPWIGDKAIIIDRFDARSNLDIVEVNPIRTTKPALSREAQIEERMCNYERYRCLVQNEFAAISEEMVLRQIEIEEKFGSEEETRKRKEEEEKKKKLGSTKAAIGYVYDDSTEFPAAGPSNDQDDEESEADSDMDIDVEIDLEELNDDHRRLLTKVSTGFGMRSGDFLRLLRRDKEVEEEVRRAKQLEEEKAQFSGKKSRRERRILKEQRLRDKHMKQPPKFNPGALGSMYTTSDNPFDGVLSSASSSGSSHSGSPTPPRSGPQFITSFGAGDDGEDSGTEAPVGPQLPSPSPLTPSFAARKRAWRRPDDEERMLDSWRNAPARVRSRSRSSEASGRDRGLNRRRGNSRSRSAERRSRSRTPDRRRSSRSPQRRRSSRSPQRRRGSRSPQRRRISRSPDRRRNSRTPDRRRGNRRDSRRSNESRSLSRSPARRANRNQWRPLGRARSRSSSCSQREAKRRRSRSTSDVREPAKPPSGPVVVKRYYRPELENSSASASESDAPSETELNVSQDRYNPDFRNALSGNQAGRTMNKATAQKMTPQEMLRLKMQLALSKTHLADKKAEKEKMEKMEKERKDRDEEMRQLVLLRRQRERRRREVEGAGRRRDGPTIGYTRGFRSSSSSSNSSSPSRRRSSSEESERRRRHSRSPKPRRFDSNSRPRHRSPPSNERTPSRALLRDPPSRQRAFQSDSRQDRYPGSNSRQEKHIASSNRPERYPASDSRQDRYLTSVNRSERCPPSENRQQRYPPSDNRQDRYPPSDNRQDRYPSSVNRSERHPATDSRRRFENNTVSSRRTNDRDFSNYGRR